MISPSSSSNANSMMGVGSLSSSGNGSGHASNYVPPPMGTVTMDQINSLCLVLPLLLVRSDGVVFHAGKSYLFRLDEHVLGPGNRVFVE
ncbi:hypothetical protein AMAG_18837 [Allomyces macrogynus ATCC 38327]|nr:hypothetical protein AMAG_18837 [Allomyces macrogynus ATCC 38327]|eukprot:KNE62278.1 hypothetical protein AMAG_18837 [Allomyces macrogynus ATCC 38327]